MTLRKAHARFEILCFLMADAVVATLRGQDPSQGWYNIERMVRSIIARGGQVKPCGTCCDARGIKTSALTEGMEISTVGRLAQRAAAAGKVLVF